MRIVLRSALLALALTSTAMAQSVSITGGVPAVETFNVMAGTHNTTASTVPSGWAFFETANANSATYLIDDGTSGSGNTFSYGAAGAGDRALGALASGSVVSTFGAALQNNTGAALSELLIQYTGEQWRQGTAGGADTLNFQYCMTTCALADASNDADWINFDGLDLVAPVTNLAEGTKLDGNLTANRIAKTGTITGLSLGTGAQMSIRWYDTNDGNVDDALAIDDFSVGLAVDNPPQLSGSSPSGSAVLVDSNVALTFSEAVTTTDPWFELNCAGVITGVLSGSGNARSFDPTGDLPYATLCTVTLTAANIRDIDGTLDPMVGSNTFSFTTVADVAPSVTSTVPADTATGVNINANLTVTFSEAVTPTIPNWLQLNCASSMAHSVAISGGPVTWTINPDSDFAFSESCTASIAANAVQDQDGNADFMAAPKAWSFTTSADLVPTVTTTTPANGAINITLASNITVNFSEPVTTSLASFTISCANSGGHSFVLSASPSSTYTLDPDSDFAETESCTVTVIAMQVVDTDGVPTQMDANHAFTFTSGTLVPDYYAGVDASSCTTLRTTLHALIDDHTVRPYTGAPVDVWTMIEAGDEDPNDPGKVLDVYRNRDYTKITDRDQGSGDGALVYNREHTWPQSLGFASATGDLGFPNAPRSDGHMIYASAKDWNADRGNKPYADCPPPGCASRFTDTHPITGGAGSAPNCDYALGNCNWVQSPDGNTGSFEVWKRRKGDTARAVLYMDIRYEGGVATGGNTVGQGEPDLVVTDTRSQIVITSGSPAYMGLKADLIRWHNGDLPDQYELLRNDAIQSYQGNRNPFIDHPEWVDCLFNCSCGPPSTPPVAVADSFNVNENSGGNLLDVLANDTDVDAGPKFVQSITQPMVGGVVAIGPSGSNVTFTPSANFCASTSFSYTLNGNSTATVSITMTCDDIFDNGFE